MSSSASFHPLWITLPTKIYCPSISNPTNTTLVELVEIAQIEPLIVPIFHKKTCLDLLKLLPENTQEDKLYFVGVLKQFLLEALLERILFYTLTR